MSGYNEPAEKEKSLPDRSKSRKLSTDHPEGFPRIDPLFVLVRTPLDPDTLKFISAELFVINNY